MKFRHTNSKSRDIEISLTPLIDLFLNILVFFLISTTFNQNKWIQINLPKTQSGESAGEKKIMAISINNQEEIFLNKEKIDQNALIELMQNHDDKSVPVILAADEKVSHGRVMQILDQIKLSGLNNISVLGTE